MDLKQITSWALEDVKTLTRVISLRQDHGIEKVTNTPGLMFAEQRVLDCVCDKLSDDLALNLLKMLTGKHAHLVFLVKIPAAVCATFLKNMKAIRTS